MANSVVKVTQPPNNDSLIMVIGEDGSIIPDKATVEEYLSTKGGATDIQMVQIERSDSKCVQIAIDNLTFSDTFDEGTSPSDDMLIEISRNLANIRMDHDYTPLTCVDESKHSSASLKINDDPSIRSVQLSPPVILNSSVGEDGSTPRPAMIKRVQKIVKQVTPVPVVVNKSKIKSTQAVSPARSPAVATAPILKIKNDSLTCVVESEVKDHTDEDETKAASESSQKVAVKSTTSIIKSIKKIVPPVKLPPENRSPQLKKVPKVRDTSDKVGIIKQVLPSTPPPSLTPSKSDTEGTLTEDSPLTAESKKFTIKKEKKASKFIPDDFALFSTPDIIRRVGTNKQEPPLTPPSETATLRPGIKTTRSISTGETSGKVVENIGDTVKKADLHVTAMPATSGVIRSGNQLEPIASCSTPLMADDKLSQNVPTADAMQVDNSSNFSTSMNISEPADSEKQFNDAALNLEASALDLDSTILDSELLSEDILLQIAQSLATNTELQNALEKSLSESDIGDTCVPISASLHQQHQQPPQNQTPTMMPKQNPTVASGGTQIVRSGGRVVVIPPIERPTTRSRKVNRPEDETPKVPKTASNRVLDDQHVSGTELDSSGDEDDDKSDDDPDKLWCICNQPHNNRFMICCDSCEEWYHGKCVNVTKAMGKLMEQQGKEWICLYCKDSSLRRPSAVAKRKRKASRHSSTDVGSEEQESAVPTPPVKLPSSPAASTVPGCLVCGKPCRISSIYCSDPCILKHAEGVGGKVVVYNSKTGNILTGNNAPNAANIDKWLQQNPNYQVVRPQDTKNSPKSLTQSKLKIVKNSPTKGGVSLAVQHKDVNVGILAHAPKLQTQQQHQPIEKKTSVKTITSVKIISKQVNTPRIKQIPVPVTHVETPTVAHIKQQKLPQHSLPKLTSASPQPLKDNIKPMPQKTPKSRQGEDTVPPHSSNKQENIRENVKKTLHEQLTNRLKAADDVKLSDEEVLKISTEIESQLHKCFGDTGQKYRNKYRSLMFNIKDGKNQTLWRRICQKSINPYQLVRLSPDDLASQELALWREREQKHQLDMITKSELEQMGSKRQYVFKTHKGEQELEDDRPTDILENTEVITTIKGDNSQTTSTKDQRKESSKDRGEKKSNKHDRDGHKSSSSSSHKSDRKRRHEDRSSSRDKSRRKRSRSKERHGDKSRESRDRHKKSSHKSSRHKKESRDNSAEKLDKKSKEILDQLVDSKIVAPLEDRLWKHVPQEDITAAPIAESDSDHEPTSTVTIPTPPRAIENEEQTQQPIQSASLEMTSIKPLNEDNLEINVNQEDAESGGSKSPPLKSQSDYIWKGMINMVDVAHISITAHEVSGDCWGLGEELPPSLDVVGRIQPDTVWEYIGKMKCSNSKVISLIRLKATNMEEKMPYLSLYTYLSSRNRLGVVKSLNKAVKDFYILPLANQKPIPQALLPINGPGFEESRPALLLGIIVRDRRKRPLLPTNSTPLKKYKLGSPTVTLSSSTTTTTTTRSYTPPPSVDVKLKDVLTLTPPVVVPLSHDVAEKMEEDDEPYTPEDSDPDSTPAIMDTSKTLNTDDISNLLTGSVKASSFLDAGLGSTQTFEPFKTKFDTIPGLEDSATISSNTQEIEKKMQELEQRIAMQKAEIDNMSQNMVASTSGNSSDLGNSTLASIALPSNLQQILDSIKGINSLAESDNTVGTVLGGPTSGSDLTIPLMLPKISSRSSTITSMSPNSIASRSNNNRRTSDRYRELERSTTTSVLSSLSEEDLIRKAAEMLGETEENVKSDGGSSNRSQSFGGGENDPSRGQPPIPGLDN